MKNFIITSLLVLAIVGTVVSSWRWYATRPANEVATRAALEEWDHLKEQAKKYPYKERSEE